MSEFFKGLGRIISEVKVRVLKPVGEGDGNEIYVSGDSPGLKQLERMYQCGTRPVDNSSENIIFAGGLTEKELTGFITGRGNNSNE